jgi:Ni,Fe-hydrogenase III large subunit
MLPPARGRASSKLANTFTPKPTVLSLLTNKRCQDSPTQPDGRARSGIGIAEGWRGTIVHRAEIAPDGRLDRVKVVDPSFFNWPALPVALTGAIVPDFPLANKSFNLSYAGNDL